MSVQTAGTLVTISCTASRSLTQGINVVNHGWIPAFAGMTEEDAGMTEGDAGMTGLSIPAAALRGLAALPRFITFHVGRHLIFSLPGVSCILIASPPLAVCLPACAAARGRRRTTRFWSRATGFRSRATDNPSGTHPMGPFGIRVSFLCQVVPSSVERAILLRRRWRDRLAEAGTGEAGPERRTRCPNSGAWPPEPSAG